MIQPAPKVDAPRVEAADPQEAPVAEKALASSIVEIENAPRVSLVHAKPASDVSLAAEVENTSDKLFQLRIPTMVESLRDSNKIRFESIAAVISGQAEKNVFQKIFPRLLDERSYVSFGEVKRYIVVVDEEIFIFADATDPSPLYTIPLMNLYPMREDSLRPHFRSHTVSPEANTGLPRANQSRETLDTVLLTNTKGKNIAFQITFDSLISGEDVVEKFIKSVETPKMEKEKC